MGRYDSPWKKFKIFWRWLSNIKRIDKKRFWRIPVMDGEFMCEETTARVQQLVVVILYCCLKIELHAFQHVK